MRTKTWFRIHSFTGVITGLLLFVICWSGTVATLSHEIDWLVTPEARAPVGAERASWGEVLAAVEAVFPDARATKLAAPLYLMSSAEVLINRPNQRRVRVYVDPYTAEVQGTHNFLNVWRFFRSFHRRLFLPNPIGIFVVSIFAITLMVSLIAALNFYKRWWRRFLRFWPGQGRALWSELHKLAGLWSLWFVLLMGVTGVWYGLEATRLPQTLLAPTADNTERAVEADKYRPIADLVAQARAARPGLAITKMYLPSGADGDGRVRVTGQGDDWLVRDRVNYVTIAANGEVIEAGSGADLSVFEYWVNMADPLHFGSFGGLITKLIWFVFGLLLCGLILSGTYLHAQRLAKDQKGRHRWPGTWAAIVVSLLVLAVSVPLGFHEAHNYGPTVDGVKQFPALAPGVQAVIIAWVVVTLGIIAGWVWILWRSAASQKTNNVDL